MWRDLNMQERSEVISLALKQGIYSLREIKDLYNSFEDGGPLVAPWAKRPAYNDWIKTVPKDRQGDNYNLERAYYIAPEEELEAWRTSSVKNLIEGKNHLHTSYKTPNGDYEFMKSKNHPTVFFEHQWYNSKEGEPFMEEYEYINSNPAKYSKRPIWQFKREEF